MAYKVFSNGDALTGSELNTYLMNQSVMVFASATARDAALPSPTEGMLVWLQDVDKYTYRNGSAWTDLAVPYNINLILNSAFDIWQRGASFTATSGQFWADRWFGTWDGTQTNRTVTRETFTPGSAPVTGYESAYFLRVVQAAAGSGGTYNTINQKIEDVRSFAGQTITLSFWAKADSARTVTPQFRQDFGSGGSGSVDTTGTAITLSTSWVRYSQTFSIPAITGKTIGTNSNVNFFFNLATNAASTYDIWGVQVEAGSVATSFKRNANSLQGELAACERYFQAFVPGTAYAHYGIGSYNSTTLCYDAIKLKTTMRATPSTTFTAANTFTVTSAGTGRAASAISVDQASPDFVGVVLTTSAATAGYSGIVQSNNTTASGIYFSAEL